MTQKNLPTVLFDREKIKSILVIRLLHYGDVLLTTPLLNTLHLNYPNAKIDVLVYAGTHHILAGYPHIRHTYTIDRSLKQQGIRAQYHAEKTLIRHLKKQRHDLILNLSSQWRTALYCRLLRPAFSIGFAHPRRDHFLWRYCHSYLVDSNRQNEQHTVEHNLQILAPLNLSKIDTTVTMRYTNHDVERAEILFPEYKTRDYILIQPTARWAFKTWSSDSFSQLINQLTATGEKIVLTAGPNQEEVNAVTRILSQCHQPDHVINLAGRLYLTELAVLIDHAKLYIGVDSAPMHMAAALQTPSVVLFGPSNLKQWHPWQAPHTLIWAGDYRTLPEVEEVDTDTKERYLEAIPVDNVMKAATEWLKRIASSS